jgi:hypothetical protein
MYVSARTHVVLPVVHITEATSFVLKGIFVKWQRMLISVALFVSTYLRVCFYPLNVSFTPVGYTDFQDVFCILHILLVLTFLADTVL